MEAGMVHLFSVWFIQFAQERNTGHRAGITRTCYYLQRLINLLILNGSWRQHIVANLITTINQHWQSLLTLPPLLRGGMCYHSTPLCLTGDITILFNFTGIAVWRLCVWERKTRSTVQMKREPSPRLIRKKGESGKAKSFPASEKWCTERLKAKKRSRMLSTGLSFLSSSLWVIICV